MKCNYQPNKEERGDPRLREIVEQYDRYKIGLDDSFRFHCTMCGKCCINREDILLSPKDLFNIAKELGLTPVEVLEQYCETYIGDTSRIPLIRLKPRGEVKRCPLLKDHKCSVHKCKPVVCAMFPLGRAFKFENGLDPEKIAPAHVDYLFMDPDCGNRSETQTVREWLDSFGIPVEDEFFLQWQRTVNAISATIRETERYADSKRLRDLWKSLLVLLYLAYDTGKDFLEQFSKNAHFAVQMTNALRDPEVGR